MSYTRILLGMTVLLIAVCSTRAQQQTAQQNRPKAANAWRQIPFDLSTPDDLSPSLRHARDEYWDSLIGRFGVLTPQTVIHTAEDALAPIGEVPEIPDLRRDEAGFIGTFARYRTVLTVSGRAIYTDVTFTIEHVFRDAAEGHATPSGEITIDLAGGTVQTRNGGIITVGTEPVVFSIQPGRSYLLWGLVYHSDGQFYLSGTPEWDVTGGIVKPNFDEVKAKAWGRKMSFVGLNKEDLIRIIHERFLSGK